MHTLITSMHCHIHIMKYPRSYTHRLDARGCKRDARKRERERERERKRDFSNQYMLCIGKHCSFNTYMYMCMDEWHLVIDKLTNEMTLQYVKICQSLRLYII